MDVFKILVFYPESGSVYKCDAINHQDGIWLVPIWDTCVVSGISKPNRMLRVDTLLLCECTFPGCRYLLVPGQLSEAALNGDVDPRPLIQVIDTCTFGAALPEFPNISADTRIDELAAWLQPETPH